MRPRDLNRPRGDTLETRFPNPCFLRWETHMGYREVPEREACHKGRIDTTARFLGTMVCRYGETKGRRVEILATRVIIFHPIAQVDLQVLSSSNNS